MNLRASSKFTPVDISRLTAKLIPKLTAAMSESVRLVVDAAQAIVPVDTGELRDSIEGSVEWSGNNVRGEVAATAPHAAYTEFGTGQRGAASPGAGPYPYNDSWKGMAAQPYLRPALDENKRAILGIFEDKLKG